MIPAIFGASPKFFAEVIRRNAQFTFRCFGQRLVTQCTRWDATPNRLQQLNEVTTYPWTWDTKVGRGFAPLTTNFAEFLVVPLKADVLWGRQTWVASTLEIENNLGKIQYTVSHLPELPPESIV
jgi:hypothetical protein